MSYHNSNITIRITILGDKGTGKTSLVKGYIGKGAEAEQVASIDTAYTKEAIVETASIVQQILDSDGKNSAVTAWAHGVIVVYSVDNEESFKRSEEYINRTRQLTMKNAKIMLVANKVDIRDRKVSLADGQKLATKYNCNYVELSALGGESAINSVFHNLSHEILEKRGLKYKHHHRRTPNMVRRIFQALTHYNRERTNTSYL